MSHFDQELLAPPFSDLNDDSDKVTNLSDLGVAGVILRWIILLLMCWKSRYAVSDAVIESIFGILSTLFSYLSRIPVVPFCGVLADSFPKTVSAASRMVGLESNKFTKFIVCRHCHSLYTDEDCFQLIGLRRVPKKCDYIQFPDHPQRQHRRPCNEVLFQQIHHPKELFIPLRTYCYVPKHSGDIKVLPSATGIF